MITVYVPFVPGRLHEETWRAVIGAGGPAQFLALDPDDDGGYGRLIRRLWAKGDSFIVCEHDVVPTRAQLATLQGCGHDWCSFPYDSDLYPDGPYFGLVRFSSRVMRDHPRAAHVALHRGSGKELEVGWWEVDSCMARDLHIRGVRWHRHTPAVQHAHDGPPSGQ
jgi:hypothetical protein